MHIILKKIFHETSKKIIVTLNLILQYDRDEGINQILKLH